jgi:hypothetical protein
VHEECTAFFQLLIAVKIDFEYFVIERHVPICITFELNTRQSAQIRARRVGNNQVPLPYLPTFSCLRSELSQSIEERDYITLNVPFWVAITSAWLNIA